MVSTRRQQDRPTTRHRTCAVLAFVSYFAVTLGLPLPVPTLKKSDQPFPCQYRSCGCQTAEQFWASCCCFTPEERLAWARANNVQPPASAERPSSSEEAETPSDAPTCCCCAKREAAETAPNPGRCPGLSCCAPSGRKTTANSPEGAQHDSPGHALGWGRATLEIVCPRSPSSSAQPRSSARAATSCGSASRPSRCPLRPWTGNRPRSRRLAHPFAATYCRPPHHSACSSSPVHRLLTRSAFRERFNWRILAGPPGLRPG